MTLSYKLIKQHAEDNGIKPEQILDRINASYVYIAQFSRPGTPPLTVLLDQLEQK